MLQIGIGASVNHEALGEFCLGEFFFAACLSKALGHVMPQFAFTGVFHGRFFPSFVKMEAIQWIASTNIVTKLGGTYYEVHTIIWEIQLEKLCKIYCKHKNQKERGPSCRIIQTEGR